MKRAISPRRTCTAVQSFPSDHTDYLVTILANQKVIDVQDAMFAAVGIIFLRVEFEPHE
jgi:hypothetical protein